MSPENRRRLESLAAEIQGQANIAERAGQYDHLHSIAHALIRIAREEDS